MALRLTLLPGIVAALIVMLAGFWLADVLGRGLLALQGVSGAGNPVSGVPIAILLGLAIRNTFRLPDALMPGLKFSVTTLLRLGIVCVGIRLSALEVVRLGLAGLPVVLGAIAAGLLFVTWFNRRLGLPPRLGTLIAAGTSICGVTAIVSTAPAIEADEREVAYAIANIVAFGLLGMLAYPYLAHTFLGQPETVGLFLGTAIHDTSQVVGAALTYRQMYGDDVVLRVATVTKLTRNLCLAFVIPYLTWLHLRAAHIGASQAATKVPIRTLVPTFIFGFLAMALARTLGDAGLSSRSRAFGIWDAMEWGALTDVIGDFWGSRVLLGTAMAAVGLNTSLAVFRGVGAKPFIVGFAGALVVGLVGLSLAVVLGPYVHL